MYTANLNFEKDFDEILVEELAELGFPVSASESSDKIRQRYFNLKRRLINAKPRQVLLSKEFSCPPEHHAGLDLVTEKFKNGADVTPHLSKQLANLDYNDSLLNDWGIYHLHLGTSLESGGSMFIERTGPVLFARIEYDKALFISVMPHGNWTNQQMVKVIHDNWPEVIQAYRLNDVIGLSHVPTDKEIGKMRKYGVNSAIEIEPGVVYAPIGGGLTTAGTSVEVTMAMIDWNRLLRQYHIYIEKNLQEFGKIVKERSGLDDKNLIFKLVVEAGEFFAFEQKSKIPFSLGFPGK